MSQILPRRIRFPCEVQRKQKAGTVKTGVLIVLAALVAFGALVLSIDEPLARAGLARMIVAALWMVLLYFLYARTRSQASSYAEVGLDGVLTSDGFLGFDRLVSVELGPSNIAMHASIELRTNDGEVFCLSVVGDGRELVVLIKERQEVYQHLTRTRRRLSDGYRNVRVEEEGGHDLVEAMRESGMSAGEIEACLACSPQGRNIR